MNHVFDIYVSEMLAENWYIILVIIMTLNCIYILCSSQISKHFVKLETFVQLEQGSKLSNYIM